MDVCARVYACTCAHVFVHMPLCFQLSLTCSHSFSGLCKQQEFMWYTNTGVGKTLMHIKQKQTFIFESKRWALMRAISSFVSVYIDMKGSPTYNAQFESYCFLLIIWAARDWASAIQNVLRGVYKCMASHLPPDTPSPSLKPRVLRLTTGEQ